MKYILYRSLGSIDKEVKKHEIVGVEFGDSIDDVTDDLIRDAADDLAALPEYENCRTAAYAPKWSKTSPILPTRKSSTSATCKSGKC